MFPEYLLLPDSSSLSYFIAIIYLKSVLPKSLSFHEGEDNDVVIQHYMKYMAPTTMLNKDDPYQIQHECTYISMGL